MGQINFDQGLGFFSTPPPSLPIPPGPLFSFLKDAALKL